MVEELMVSAAMAIQGQSGGTGSLSTSAAGNGVSLSSGLHSVSGVQLVDQFSSRNDYAPKVRKPYTITKQRERWTEEEHKKFLEALKMYGRVWRKIEEHVGTKTAVQIRSHAQKFFSKIVRDLNGGNPIESVEIPPPRPKRKPMHPYPRKIVQPPKVKTIKLKSPMRSGSPNSATCDHERSPTSVLSAFGSEIFGSIESDTLNGSLSAKSTFTANNDGTMLQEDGLAPTQFTISTSKPPMMNSPCFPGSYVNPVEETVGTRILKLFGRIVMVADSHQPSLPITVTSRFPTPEMHEQEYAQSSILKFAKVEASHAQCSENSMREEPNNTAYHMQHHSNDSNLEVAHAAASVLCSFMPNQKQELGDSNLDSCAGVKTIELQNERSWTGSSAASANCEQKSESSESETESTKGSNMIKARDCSILSEVRTKCERSKGFMPYKRCVAERHGFCSMMSSEERKERLIRLSL